MDLRQLRHLVAVAQEMSFSRAAKRLNIVQSALSASVAGLEAEFQVKLFVRNTRRITLTPAGAALLDKAMAAIEAAQQVHRTAAAMRAVEAGSLAIGSVQSLPAFVDIPAMLARYHQHYPGVRIALRQAGRDALIEQVGDGRLDIAFLPGTAVTTGLDVVTVADMAMMLACVPGDPLAAQRTVALADLSGRKFVDFQPNWGTRPLIDHMLSSASVSRESAFEVNDLATLMALVGHGLGIALVPEGCGQHRIPGIVLRPLADARLRWRTILAHAHESASRPLPPAARAFLDLVPRAA